MADIPYGVLLTSFLFIISTQAHSFHVRDMSKHTSDINNSPLVVLIDTNSIVEDNTSDEDESETNEPEVVNEHSAYVLYHILRVTLDNEPLDTEIKDHFEKTKDILRASLRRRCFRLDKCVQRCPPKKMTCVRMCQEKIDESNVCEEVKKKDDCRPKCGKTMPPYW